MYYLIYKSSGYKSQGDTQGKTGLMGWKFIYLFTINMVPDTTSIHVRSTPTTTLSDQYNPRTSCVVCT